MFTSTSDHLWYTVLMPIRCTLAATVLNGILLLDAVLKFLKAWYAHVITKSHPTSPVCWTFRCVHSPLWFWWLSLNLFQLLTPRHASWDGLRELVWCSMAFCHHQRDYLCHSAGSCQLSFHHLWPRHQSHCHNDLDCSHPGPVRGYSAQLRQAACCHLEERHLQ